MYVADNSFGTVVVIPAKSGTLYGQAVTAGQPTTLMSGLAHPTGVAIDSKGNLYVSNFAAGSISVLPAASGTLFGVAVTADTPATLVSSGMLGPTGLAVDSSGNLYVSNTGNSELEVLPQTSGTLFGQAVTADQLNELLTPSQVDEPTGLAIDSTGNLYISNYGTGTIGVLPAETGTVYGESVTADTPTTILSGLSAPCGLTIDSAGNLYIANLGTNTIGVLPAAGGYLYTDSVSQDGYTTLSTTGPNNPEGIATDNNSNLYYANNGGSTITKLAP
jgi:sugar lactone lactonase YvrE